MYSISNGYQTLDRDTVTRSALGRNDASDAVVQAAGARHVM